MNPQDDTQARMLQCLPLVCEVLDQLTADHYLNLEKCQVYSLFLHAALYIQNSSMNVPPPAEFNNRIIAKEYQMAICFKIAGKLAAVKDQIPGRVLLSTV